MLAGALEIPGFAGDPAPYVAVKWIPPKWDLVDPLALTDAINKTPYVPGRIGQLGLFREQGVSTTSVMIEEREGSLNLVETTARGAPAIQNTTNKRKARSLVVPHIALADTILADEVQNVRAFGSETLALQATLVIS